MSFNLLTFAAFSLYHFKSDPTKQTAVAYTSTFITFLLLVGVIAYHVYLLIRKENTTVELDENSLASIQPGVTHRSVDQPQCDPPEPDSDNTELTKNSPILTHLRISDAF